jgi:hypothetical protein
MDFWEDPNFLHRIRRHFVGLCGVYVPLNEDGSWAGEERAFSYSGFVIQIGGCWCYVTAGHIFASIDLAIARKQIKLLKCAFAHYFSAGTTIKEPLPVAYEDVQRITVFSEGVIDIGIIPLRDYYRLHLEGNDVRPIELAQWTSHRPPVFDRYALLGLPEEAMEPATRMGERAPQIGHHVTLNLVGVEALTRPPDDRISSPIPRFAGVLNDLQRLGDVTGMSGGPIIGVSGSEASGWDYRCVAVQGSWDSDRRFIYGTPVSVVVDQISRLLSQEEAPQS